MVLEGIIIPCRPCVSFCLALWVLVPAKEAAGLFSISNNFRKTVVVLRVIPKIFILGAGSSFNKKLCMVV